MHHRMTKGLQSGMRSKKSLQSIQHTNSTKSSSRQKRHYSDVIRTEITSHQRRRIPRPASRNIPMKGCTKVDNGSSLHMMGLSSLNKKQKLFDGQVNFWMFRQPSGMLWSQTRKQRSTSRNLALTYGYICGRLTVSVIVGKTMQ